MILYDIPFKGESDGSYGVTLRLVPGDPMTVYQKSTVIELDVEGDEYSYCPELTIEQARALAAALVIAADMKERSEK